MPIASLLALLPRPADDRFPGRKVLKRQPPVPGQPLLYYVAVWHARIS